MHAKNHMNTHRHWLIDIISLTLLCFIFYTLWLGHYPLFTPDEGRYSEVAREMIATGDYITPRVNGVAFLDKPILYYWLQALSIKLFGLKEWALRFFPALLGIACCLMTYACGRNLFNRRTGLISAAILATTPLFFVGAHYANLDLEVAALISCSLLLFLMGAASHSPYQRYYFIAAYLFAALAFLTKGLIAIAFPSLIGGIWIILLKRWQLLKKMHLFTGIMLFLTITLPWYILVQKANPEFLHYFFITQQVTRFLSGAEFNNVTPFWFYLPTIALGFFPWTVFILQAIYSSYQKIRKEREQHATELYLLLWSSIILLFFSIPHSKIAGYILPIFPALALLVGNYLAALWDNTQTEKIYWNNALFIIINLFAAILLIFIPIYFSTSLTEKFTPYLMVIASAFSISAMTATFFLLRKKLSSVVLLAVVTNVIFLLTLTSGAKHLNQNTAKPLVSDLKSILHPEDEVINYYKFYQDVPLYLEKQVTLVANWSNPDIVKKDNWVRELWYGMPFQKTENWLINEETFWQRFDSEARVFVFLNTNYFEQFKERAPHYFVLGRYNDIILLSNKPTILSKNP